MVAVLWVSREEVDCGVVERRPIDWPPLGVPLSTYGSQSSNDVLVTALGESLPFLRSILGALAGTCNFSEHLVPLILVPGDLQPVPDRELGYHGI